jgi:glycosyltransferase involved in cell wall biosynthesis
VEGRVTLAGFVPDKDALLDLYRSSDILVLATESEGFPRVLYEAMSQSLPIVATSIPPIAAVVVDGEHACLVPPRSPDAVVEAIRLLRSSPALRRRLIANAFALATARLSGPSTAQQILDLLAEHPLPQAGGPGRHASAGPRMG